MKKIHLFFLLTILIPVIFFVSYMKKDIESFPSHPIKTTLRPMVELTDEELNQVIGQAGIQFINENFNFTFTPTTVTTISEFQNQLMTYMTTLQQTDPTAAMETYVDMINTVNNPNIIAGPNVTHIQIDMQHVMENVIMNGVNFMSSTSSQTGIGTFGIIGLEVHAPGTFHIFIRND